MTNIGSSLVKNIPELPMPENTGTRERVELFTGGEHKPIFWLMLADDSGASYIASETIERYKAVVGEGYDGYIPKPETVLSFYRRAAELGLAAVSGSEEGLQSVQKQPSADLAKASAVAALMLRTAEISGISNKDFLGTSTSGVAMRRIGLYAELLTDRYKEGIAKVEAVEPDESSKDSASAQDFDFLVRKGVLTKKPMPPRKYLRTGSSLEVHPSSGAISTAVREAINTLPFEQNEFTLEDIEQLAKAHIKDARFSGKQAHEQRRLIVLALNRICDQGDVMRIPHVRDRHPRMTDRVNFLYSLSDPFKHAAEILVSSLLYLDEDDPDLTEILLEEGKKFISDQARVRNALVSVENNVRGPRRRT
ncbi:TPA: hypothetical protein EYO12_02845 [Candidatus Saccharibacteria bacterium]|nr:hypothetical protein [Candidatus Saccharibacteria bacterium]HIO88023.1 hypothetical protein [Candidatus Saccharibacteria bacterium]